MHYLITRVFAEIVSESVVRFPTTTIEKPTTGSKHISAAKRLGDYRRQNSEKSRSGHATAKRAHRRKPMRKRMERSEDTTRAVSPSCSGQTTGDIQAERLAV